MKKIGLLVKKVSSGFLTGNRASGEIFWGKRISLSRNFFSVIIFGVWVFSLSFCKTVVRYVKPPIIVQREINGKYNLKKMFSLNNFGLWAAKTWNFSKTVRHDSQNRSLHAQMNIFRFFSGIKIICMKVFGHWTETSDFWLKCFLRVVKAAFQVFSATLREKDDKSELYILSLV